MENRNVSVKRQQWKYVLTDFLTANVAFMLFNLARYCILIRGELWEGFLQYIENQKLLVEQLVIPIIMLGIYWLSGYYNKPFGKSRLQELVTTLFSSIINTAWIYLALLTNDQILPRRFNWGIIIILLIILFTVTYIGRLSLTQHSIRCFRNMAWGINTIIIGNSFRARKQAKKLAESQASLGYRICGFVRIPGEDDIEDNETIMNIEDLKEVCSNQKIDQLIISPQAYRETDVLRLLYSLFPLGLPIKMEPDMLSYMTSSIHMQSIYDEPFIDLTSPSVSESSKNLKRTFDVVGSALMLILLTPLYLTLAILIKLDSKGPVIYRQERIGYQRKAFNIYKFRSMRVDAEANGPQLSSENDPRITRVGSVMRKYRLDELPQFWNVIKGDMSLVGPRPEREYYVRKIMERAPYYCLVNQVRPGITSWAMVKYGYAQTVEEMVKRTRYDLIYLANMNNIVDLKILVYTVKTVFKGLGM